MELLLKWKWWDLEPEKLAEALPLLCGPDLEKARRMLKEKYFV